MVSESICFPFAQNTSSKSIGYIVNICTFPTGNEYFSRFTATPNKLPAAKDEFKKTGADKLSIEEAVQLVQKIAETEKLHTTVDPQALWKAYGMQEPDLKRNILRGEMAVMIDQVLDPFNKKQIDITGKYIQ